VNVLLISQCEKRALSETRRIIDQFAERRGDRTWQTPITEIGLNTLRTMLRRTARKNTSVACHWIRGHDQSELIWIVGDAGRFNDSGAVPTNTTSSDVLRSVRENDWHQLEDIKLLATMSSLFHDFGKASGGFQDKLRSAVPVSDAYRHEWVSLRLFEAFARGLSDAEWLGKLAKEEDHTQTCLSQLIRDDHGNPSSPFVNGSLSPLAQLVGWLIVSHHRLPLISEGQAPLGALKRLPMPILATWNACRPEASSEEKDRCWRFERGLPFSSADWRMKAGRCASSLLNRTEFLGQGVALLDDPYVAHLSRLALMLGDHHYSSCPSSSRFGDRDFPLFANTDRKTYALKQRLDEHLVGVSEEARKIVKILPTLNRDLPRIARHRAFKRRTSDDTFRWQDKAYDLAVSSQRRSEEFGFFGVNLASTGMGKTVANGRIMYGLSHPERGARFTIALGLRTLTLQTGDAYREQLGMGADELAVLVGGAAIRELYAIGEREKSLQRCGSESSADLLPDNSHVHFEGNVEDGPLTRWLQTNPSSKKLLEAPVLACTIDHLVPATESIRGGHQIAPLLRLLTSDLVLDEPDDFDLDDLPALSRLVHWGGVLGSRVLLSSATLPPSLVEGLFAAYLEGRRVFQRHQGVQGRPLNVCCAWFDEFRCLEKQHADNTSFRSTHDLFVSKRIDDLRSTEQRRRAKIVQTMETKGGRDDFAKTFAKTILESITELHHHHNQEDPATGKRVSFGLVRMANIEPLIQVALQMFSSGAPVGCHIHLCVYHSRHPMLMRSKIERLLDGVLKRHDPLGVFGHRAVKGAMEQNEDPGQIFVVLASPVAEVGRDHDYDWAIAEPSSMRSIIQLCGRVRRHRPGPAVSPNVFLLNTNVKAFLGAKAAFVMPGFERADDFLLASHSLKDILSDEEISEINAIPRIAENNLLSPTKRLVDLEHQRLRRLMLSEGAGSTELTVPAWWTSRAHLSGEMQRSMKFRKGSNEETYALVSGEDDVAPVFSSYSDNGTWIRQANLLTPMELSLGPRISKWGVGTYQQELADLAGETNRDVSECSRRYGTVQLRQSLQGWSYHPSLGFKRNS